MKGLYLLFISPNVLDPEKPNNPLVPRKAPSETLEAAIKKINVYFRIKNLDHHVDLLHVFCSVDTTIQDWSKQVRTGPFTKLLLINSFWKVFRRSELRLNHACNHVILIHVHQIELLKMFKYQVDWKK